jgi:chromosome segregation protein
MRLEQIVLHGFKSFAEKTDVRVLPGITCIVGPNGCGKSNVADAIRWALGEQSPKTLRGQKMEDVIFHGAASRKSIGMAEVSLVFGNDGGLGVPWSEVAVARRLYRTGESEYLLNRSGCRLRDIQDLFAGTGVNPKAYALMDQERLNHVLTAKPWERRVFIEEAAGIARYKQQRAETQGKLDATRQNLQRVRDVMDEVRRQLGSLERQARKAQQYKALHAEKQALGLAMLAADFAVLTARHDALAREMERLRFEQDQRVVQQAALASRQAIQSAAIQETEFRLADLRQLVQKIQGEAERLIERREQLAVQIRELDEEDARLGGEIRAVGERRVVLDAEREDKVQALAEGRERHADWLARLADLEEEAEAARREVEQRRERLEALRFEQVAAGGRRAELTREDGELRERGLNQERALARLAAEATQAGAEADAVVARRLRVEERRRAAGHQLSLLESERRQVQVEREGSEAERERLQGALGDLRLALAARESQLEALEQLEREREGYGAGVRAVFAAGNGTLAGVVGTVADLLEVPPGLEAAVEGVLGERLQWVVVERFEHARAALGHLEREGAGPATFLPLETLPANGSTPEDSRDVRWASRLIGGPQPGLLRYLLGRVGVVDHLDQAERLWRRNGVVATYVTPAGEVLYPTGRLTGGRRDGDREAQDHSILRRKRAIRQLGEQVAATSAEVERERGRLDALEAALTALRAREVSLVTSLQSREAERLTGDKDLEAAARETERLERYLATLAVERAQIESEHGGTARRIAEVSAALAEAREREGAFEGALGSLRSEVEAAERADATLAAEIGDCRVQVAAVAERVEGFARDIERLEELGREAGERLDGATLRRAQLADRRTELSGEAGRADARARDTVVDRDRLEGEVRATAEIHQAQLAERQAVESELRAAEADRQRLVGRIHDLELQDTEGRVRSEELIQEARRSHGVDGSEPLLAAHDPGRDPADLRARHVELTQKLEAMGAVNLVADEEYRELEERLGFLRAQYDDLTGSIKDLERALRGMTRTAQDRFREAFDQVNRHFGEIFARLFEGGRAELRMVEPEEGEDDPLEQGVELMAQPRGKRLQAVSLMSGGEKALTGLALLFAIFYFRPSPFCVLDEVDAPLDDANIHRFLRVLRELCSQTQFIVITHNRKTMEAADVLYGVTMEEPGLSRLVSVQLTEA